ncbi:MAG: GNAT family N-acetyltransferase [Clostridia bacterium]|nr:GNAT family N-acetyltransferase [Clostridia bacterium]
MNEREILAYLERDKTIRIDMIEAIRRHTATVEYAAPDAVLLKTAVDDYLLAGDTADACERALKRVSGDFDAFVAHDEVSREAVQKAFPRLNRCSPCWQAYYPKTEPIPLPDVCEIRPFPLDQVPFLVSVYDPDADPADYEERVKRGDVLAAYRDGKIAGFIGFHEDGSGGMLEVLPAFRRLGIGTALEIGLHNLALSRGWTPYGQIYVGNEASRKLQESLGMVVSDPNGSILYWIYRKED